MIRNMNTETSSLMRYNNVIQNIAIMITITIMIIIENREDR